MDGYIICRNILKEKQSVGEMTNVNCYIVVSEYRLPVTQFCSFEYTWERHEPPYPHL